MPERTPTTGVASADSDETDTVLVPSSFDPAFDYYADRDTRFQIDTREEVAVEAMTGTNRCLFAVTTGEAYRLRELTAYLDKSVPHHAVDGGTIYVIRVGAPGSDDLRFARQLTRELGVPHQVINVSPGDIRADDVREAIQMSELTEYGDIINAIVSVPLFARASDLGIKVASS